MFDELFRRRTIDIQKAILFGFVQSNSSYIYETDIIDGSFFLQIVITPDGNIDTKLTDKAIWYDVYWYVDSKSTELNLTSENADMSSNYKYNGFTYQFKEWNSQLKVEFE